MRFPLFAVLLVMAGAMSLSALEDPASFQVLRLPLGEGKNRFELVRIPLNGFVSSRSGQSTSSEETFRELAAARVVLVGEGHTSDQHHQLQLKIIRGLFERGRKVVIALEMFNPAQNQALADFSTGRISEAEFLKQADWVSVWGHDYRYYQPIFAFAREFGVPLVGVNLPHKLVSKVTMGGLASLSEDEKKIVPVPETTNAEHRFLVNSMMQGVEALAPEIFANMYISQCLWDAAMGDGAIRAADEFPDHTVVVLAGTGHVAYGLGIPRIVQSRSSLPVLTVMPVDVPIPSDEAGKPGKASGKSGSAKKGFMVHLGDKAGDASYPHEIVSRTLADFLVGVPAEKHEKYPTLGVNIKTGKDGKLTITRVLPDSLAEKAGLSHGDMILKVNGRAFADPTSFKTFLSGLNWGDSLKLDLQQEKVRRQKTIRFQPDDKDAKP